MTDSKPMRAELVDDYRIKCALLLEEVIDAEEAAKLAAAEIAELRAERDRLKAEVAFVKGQLAGTNKNIAGWLQSRDDNLRRAEFAEAQLDEALSGCRETNSRAEAAEARAERLREALEVIAYNRTAEAHSVFAARALEDDKPIRAAAGEEGK